MASTDGFTPESRIEQWLFDYLTYKCVSNSTQSREVNETTKMFLEALMSQSVNPDHGTNDIKANLLIVLDCQIQLADLGISNLQSAQSDKLLQSKETVSDFLNMMNGLRNSLVYLKESFGSKSTSLFALCKRCILHTYVIIIQFFHRLKVSPEPLYGDTEISGWTSKFLKKAEKCADSASEKDARIVQACVDLSKGKVDAASDLPDFEDYISLLDRLVKSVHASCGEPLILQLSKSFSQICSKLEKAGNEDIITRGLSSKSSLEKIIDQCNNSSSADERRHTKSKGKENPRHRLSGSEERSDLEEMVTPRKKSRNQDDDDESRAGSPQKRPGVSKAVRRFRELDGAWSPKGVKKLSKKPVSHARVKLGPWTPAEEEKFVLSVLRIGVGKWAEVKEDIQALRSSVQLKDKWRNIPKARIRSIAREHGLANLSKT